jgi:arylamine N-acetyltransferase
VNKINTKKIQLLPEQFKEASAEFLDYFNIKPSSPDLLYLEQILNNYTNLPYENISKIIKLGQDFTTDNRIRLPNEVIDDHEKFHFGGTCFSLTFYLQSILLFQGFNCYPVMADMRNQPNVHCALIVLYNQKKYLVDPGYLLTRPMEMSKDNPRLYKTSHTGVELRFAKEDERYHLYTFDRQQVKWRYQFIDRPISAAELLKHWQDSFYKGTMHGIVLTKVQKDGMIYMHNDYLKITSIEGQQTQRLKSNYFSVVQNTFGFDPQLIEQAQEAMQRNMALERELGFFKTKKGANATE